MRGLEGGIQREQREPAGGDVYERRAPVLRGRRVFVYPDPVPFWLRRKDRELLPEGRVANLVSTCNVRFSADLLRAGLRFDESLGLCGGEDRRCGGWLFQAGLWSDHPDYAQAGRVADSPGPAPAPVPGIGEDASHSHRLPLWLTSLAEAYPPGSEPRAYYLRLRTGLARQFQRAVLTAPVAGFPGYRTTNYMDGHNGLYRWGYPTIGPDDGYRPYELSGTFLLGCIHVNELTEDELEPFV